MHVCCWFAVPYSVLLLIQGPGGPVQLSEPR